MEPTTQKHIESREGVCGGKPCVAGTRIRVWDIYVHHEVRGMTPDEIVAQYPELSLADVHAAMAYYWDNREAIDQQMKDADEFVDQLVGKAHHEGPVLLEPVRREEPVDQRPMPRVLRRVEREELAA